MMKKRLTGISAAVLALMAGTAAGAAPAYDLIIRSGTILDGSGLLGFEGDVAVKGGHIVAVGDLAGAEAAQVIDASGLMVAPGFINIHSHSEADAVGTAVNTLTQGITTEMINSDGSGAADIGAQLAQFAANGLAENIGAYIGFNYVWTEIVGRDDRRATAGEIGRMRSLIETNLERGAWGVSAGLDYKPGYYAEADEVVKVVSVARPWRTNFPNHDRLRPEEGYSSFKAMQETIAIGEQAGLVPVITHMKSQGAEQGNAPNVIDLMRKATDRGTYVAADIYPYLAGQSGLSSLIIPGWAVDGGRPAMLQRFKDPAIRAKIIAEAERAMKLRFGGPSGVYVINTGEELTKVMSDLNVGAGEAVIRLLEREEMGAILRFGSEADLKALLAYRDSAMACDCGATLRDKVHPRAWGSFPRLFGHYVRDEKIMSWEDAVRKSTALPATIIGSVDRGYLAPGMAADIAIFDPATVTDNATYEAPTKVSEGVRYVLVNGKVALAEGKATGAKGGETLARRFHMPSRPMSVGDRSVSVLAASPGLQVSLAAEQGASDRAAKGHLQILDMGSGITWISRSLGVVQTADDWASLTATVEDNKGNIRPVTVTVDKVRGEAGKKAMPAVIVDFADPSSSALARAVGKPRIQGR
ncbi:N-acyl-D-amino-acid deacylase family protein [Sphingosinicella rhizophila]|uniref:Amidohydrolase family protein n=1 Tax=Sphingosinicella rhizophila TaxID=3050082 RepID=A0ABU3QCJ2_9SPHN|nr:amidohydrolase family protein [Sphingosinicella sp. GR2756]MDT9600670.1 amidohydrolase family protein [Sphingosinicella sp. GR2756]